MEYITVKTQFIFSSIFGIIFASLGRYDTLLQILVALVVTDYFSGITVAIKNKRLSSKTGFNGIVKKVFVFSVIYLANLIDSATGTDAFRNIAVMFYISNEGISVLENLGKIGVKYPPKIKQFLEQLGGEEDENIKNSKSDN